jgi:hypothetical protein
MKLTRRQVEFIKNLIDLSDEFNSPIHYSVLAERLGVSPFTAYDMLCLLEEKGFVTSEYQLSAEKNGPGRAERLFYPKLTSDVHKEMLNHEFGGRIPGKEEHKKFVLERLQSGEFLDREFAEEVLARVPDIEQGELSFCVEIMTIVVLRLRQHTGRKLLLGYLPYIFPTDEFKRENLTLLGGFAFGILAQECVEKDDWVQNLLVYIQKYLSIVINLSDQKCDQLSEELLVMFEKLLAQRYD